MKIALINNLYSQQARGGAEIIVEKLKQALEKNGHDCFVISTAPKKTIKKLKNTNITVAPKDENDNYLISSLYYNLNKLPYLIKLFWYLDKQIEVRSINKIKKILKYEQPDLIISHNLSGFGIKIYQLIEKSKIVHIHYLHDTQMLHPSGRIIYQHEKIINSLGARIYQKIQIKYSNKVNLIISPSKWLLELYLQKGFFKNTKIWQKFNPLENTAIQTIDNDYTSKFTFIYTGQIDKNKGVEIMIKAFLKLVNKELELKIIGNGQDLKKLKEKYNKYKNIIFLGKLSYQKTLQELKSANTLILPSLIYENSPTALFDALKLNKDIIATKLGGNIEIINKYYGQLVTPNNVTSLKKAMDNSLNKKTNKKPVNLHDLQVNVYIEELFKQLHLS
jgi:glycosyltransferase involved in cell wall biosynthesis